jgi:hypothetical protein
MVIGKKKRKKTKATGLMVPKLPSTVWKGGVGGQ